MNMCDLVRVLVIVSFVASGINGDYSARSWGDPHITTVDKVQYDFNGHGEYTFLKTGNTTVQVRADYMTPGNNDSTIFVAVAIKDDIGQFEAQLNRTSGVVTVYKAGVDVCSSNDSPPKGGPPMFPCGLSSTAPGPVRGVLVGNRTVSFTLKGFGSYMKTLTLKGGTEISITLEGIKDNIPHANLSGLAGGSVNGIMVANQSQYNVSKPEEMFAFGESWRISEDESLFNYSLSPGNYSTYNTFSRPTFYEDYLTNLTALFNLNGHQHNDLDIDEFEKTCNESKVRDECLLAIARSDKIEGGEAVNINYRQEQYLYNMRHNTPPYFKDEIPVLDVYLADNSSIVLNLSYYVHDNNTRDILTFLVETNLPKTDFKLDNTSGLFKWTVLPSLRYLNGSIQITFIVHDRFNGTVVRDVEVNFCGCNKTSQCDKQHFDWPNNAVICDCHGDKYATGDYCELRLDPCNVTTCFNQSLCNEDHITNDTGPCAPCPKGRYDDFQSDQQICHDVDECDSTYHGDDKCDVNSNCTNTDGSYTCTCHHGYRLMSNGYQCEDRDECQDGTKCGENEICRNTLGHYACDCIGGYGRESGTCAKLMGVSFVLSAEWHITAVSYLTNKPDTTENRDIIKTYLTTKLNETVVGYVDIEIFSISILTKTDSNRVRRTPGNQLLSVVYILHLVNYTMDKDRLREHVSQSFNVDITPPKLTAIPLEPMKPDTYIKEDGLCSLPGRTECDLDSTVCNDSNGKYSCDCKDGYERKQQTILNLCNEINECLSYEDQCITHGGVCQNLPGSWNCTCPHNTIWMDVGTEDAPLYRCQRNHTYVGNVTFVSVLNITNDYIRDFVTKQLNMALSNSTMNGSTDPPLTVKQLFVSSTIKEINWTQESHSNLYEVMFTLRFGLPMATNTLQDILSSIPTRDGDIYKMHFTVFNESANKLCDFPNECDLLSTICRTENGTVQCNCKDGFTKSSSPTICLDRDECKEEDYCLHGHCQNTHGSWICQCPSGYENNTTAPNKITCHDIDECNTNRDICENGNCTNTNGSFICHCFIGFVNNDNDNTTCQDINECTNQVCNNGDCNNTVGSWHCDCHDGFKHSGSNIQSCVDIDECSRVNQCRNGTCINTIGSFKCDCHDGYYHDGNITCLDINECTNQGCDNGNCNNTIGSWHCDCHDGFKNNGTDIQSCVDIDECKENPSACIGSLSRFIPCVNLKGSWKCNCESGHLTTVNATTKMCSDGFLYMAYLHIVSEDNADGNNYLSVFIQKDIWNYFANKFPDEPVSILPSINIIPDKTGISALFVLSFGLPKSKAVIEQVWESFKKELKTCSIRICQSNGTYFLVNPGDFVIEGVNQRVCEVQGKCDLETTYCNFTKGLTMCECKEGFQKSTESSTRCDKVEGQTIQVIQSGFNFTVSTSANTSVLNTTLTDMISEAYKAKYNRSDIIVIILTITNITTERRKRSAGSEPGDSPVETGSKFTCKYKVLFNESEQVIPVNNTITSFLEEQQKQQTAKPYDIFTVTVEDPAMPTTEIAAGSLFGTSPLTTSSTTTSSTTTSSTTASSTTASSTTDKNAQDMTKIMIAIGSSLGGLVVILTVVLGCVYWRKRQPEKTKFDAMPEHISMDAFEPVHDFKPVNPAYSSNHHLNQSAIYDPTQGKHGSFSYSHAHYHQSNEGLYPSYSFPGLRRIDSGSVKVLPPGGPHRPPSPSPDYQEPEERRFDGRQPSPQPDYNPHNERDFESKWSFQPRNSVHGHVVRNGVSVLPMARPRSMENLAPNYNRLPSAPIYSQPHKQRRGSFGNY